MTHLGEGFPSCPQPATEGGGCLLPRLLKDAIEREHIGGQGHLWLDSLQLMAVGITTGFCDYVQNRDLDLP